MMSAEFPTADHKANEQLVTALANMIARMTQSMDSNDPDICRNLAVLVRHGHLPGDPRRLSANCPLSAGSRLWLLTEWKPGSL